MQEQMWRRYRAAGALLALAACASEPTGPAKPIGSSGVWFIATDGQVMLEDRSPVANAFVNAVWFEDPECEKGLVDDATVQTDAEGRYSILLEGHAPAGCLDLSVTPEPGSEQWRIYTFRPVDELEADGPESFLTMEWLIAFSSLGAAEHRTR